MQYKYALLKYKGVNIGDEIQSIAAKQFLPRIDISIYREGLNRVESKQKIKMIMNGWFTPKPDKWPPSPSIEPLFISFHISEKHSVDLTSDKSIQYFKQHEPIGCRDYYTRDLLRSKGVDTYFSGCLTLTLKRSIKERSDEVLLVDLNKKIMESLPPKLLNNAILLSHSTRSPYIKNLYNFLIKKNEFICRLIRGSRIKLALDKVKKNDSKKTKMAEQLLDRYARAKLVVTSRLHCALPCLAFNTPVIFIHENLKDPRFRGLLKYLRGYSPNEFKKKVHEIEWDNLRSNPKSIEAIRNNLIKTCEKFIGDSRVN